MPKRKDFEDYQEEAEPAPVAEVKQPKQYYTLAMWAGVLPIFHCPECGQDSSSEDEMIMHVLIHILESERGKVFEELLKERKTNG